MSGETAAEVIYHRADAEKEFMGLMNFAGEQPTLREAKIAKNYLNEKEPRSEQRGKRLPSDGESIRWTLRERMIRIRFAVRTQNTTV